LATLNRFQKFRIAKGVSAVDKPIWDIVYPSQGSISRIITPFAFKAINCPNGKTFVFRGLVYPNTAYENDVGVWQLEIKDYQVRLSYYCQETWNYVLGSWMDITVNQWYYIVPVFVIHNSDYYLDTYVEVFNTPDLGDWLVACQNDGLEDDYDEGPMTQFSLRMYCDCTGFNNPDVFEIEMSPPVYLNDTTDSMTVTSVCFDESEIYSYKNKASTAVCKDGMKVDDVALFFSNEEAYEDNSVAGTETPQTPVGATDFSDLESIFSNIADELDKVLTLPTASFELPTPFEPIASMINDFCNNLISPSFEFITDCILDGFKALVNSGAYLLEQLTYGLRDIGINNIDTILSWIKTNLINVTAYQPATYNVDVGQYMYNIIDTIDSEAPGLLDNLKFYFTDVYPLNFISYYNLKIPYKYSITVLGHSFGAFNVEDIVLDLLSMGRWSIIKDQKVPYSELAPYHDDDYERRTNGFTWGELIKDGIVVGGIATASYFLSKFIPPSILLHGLQSLFTTVYPQPRVVDVLDAIGVGYDANYAPTGDTISERCDTIDNSENQINAKLPTGFGEIFDTEIDSLKAEIEEIAAKIGSTLFVL